jgi:hypothetical protein
VAATRYRRQDVLALTNRPWRLFEASTVADRLGRPRPTPASLVRRAERLGRDTRRVRGRGPTDLDRREDLCGHADLAEKLRRAAAHRAR